MFPTRYFPDRYYAPRYWPKVGANVSTGEFVFTYILGSLIFVLLFSAPMIMVLVLS